MAGGLQACAELEHLVPPAQELAAGLLVVALEPSPALGQPLLPGLQLVQQGCPHPRQRPEMGQHGRDVLELGGGKGPSGCRGTHPTKVLLTLLPEVISRSNPSRSPHRRSNVELGVQGALVALEEHNPLGTWDRAPHLPRGGHHAPQVVPEDTEAPQTPSQPLPAPQQPRQLLLQAVGLGSPLCRPCPLLARPAQRPLPPRCRNLRSVGTRSAGTWPRRGRALSPAAPAP